MEISTVTRTEGALPLVLRSCLLLGLLLGSTVHVWARHALKAEAAPVPQINLRVYDYQGLQAELLNQALHHVVEIFADAGVVIEPIVCTQDEPPAVCNHPLDPLNLALHIVPKPVPGGDSDALGYAAGQCITVNYSGVKEVVDHSQAFLDKLLGCVVAHELGHVLLGPDSHSATGIMTASLTDKELSPLRAMFIGFLPFQKARLRAYLLTQTRDLGAGSIALVQR